MDKFIESAEAIKRRLAVLAEKGETFDASMLVHTEKDDYSDAVLDAKILVCEFGNKALIDELAKYHPIPQTSELSYILDKLIEISKFRSK